MHTYRNTLAALAVAVAGLLVGTAAAQTNEHSVSSPKFTDLKLHEIETNLILALQNGYPEMQASAAQTLRELKMYNPEYSFSRSVIPLMKIAKSERDSTSARLCAILALFDLKSGRGDFAIQMTGKFSDNRKVRELCTWLTYVRQHEGEDITGGPVPSGEIVQKY